MPAWPEIVILILLGALALLLLSLGMAVGLDRLAASGFWIVLWFAKVVLLPLWIALRAIDWLCAGPARRKHYLVRPF